MKKNKTLSMSLLLITISLLIIVIVKNNNWIAEYIFARGVSKVLSQIINNITTLIPLSIMEISIYTGIILIVRFIIQIIVKLLIAKEYNKENIYNILLKTGLVFNILLFTFIIFAGVNYYRYPFAKINNMIIEDSNLYDLYGLNMELAREAYELREQLELTGEYINDEGILKLTDKRWKELTHTLDDAFTNLSVDYPIFKGNYGSPKQVLYSKFMSRMEITGIYWPFTLEANINVHAPDYTLPATMAHEMAHLRGFMREDEANYIAYLACRYSDDLVFKYSGTMLALTSAGNALYKEDIELYAKTRQNFNEGMIADLRDRSVYWRQFDDTVISTVSNKMNDTYLKANNQKDGVKSYGRVVDLLLADYKDRHNH